MKDEPDRSEILAEAVEVVNNARLGVLATVDENGVPQARWMTIGALVEGVRVIYTITREDSRKLAQIEKNPTVCWVFAEPDYRRGVTLYGRAYPDYSPMLRQKVWDQVADHHLLFCVQCEESELIVLTTIVDRVELIHTADLATPPAVVVFENED